MGKERRGLGGGDGEGRTGDGVGVDRKGKLGNSLPQCIDGSLTAVGRITACYTVLMISLA